MVAVLLISFDGTNYCGWQVQKNVITIQSLVQKAVEESLKIQTKIVGCSRTDAGVHALGYVCSFPLPMDFKIPPEQLAFAINQFLPNDIRILKSTIVQNDTFHACISAVKKRYRYSFYCNKIDKPLLQRYAVRVYPTIDLKKMQKCAILLQGTKDFKAFSNAGSNVNTTVRTIYSIVLKKEKGIYTLDICGDGFLYNMVRILAGSLIAVGQGRLKESQLLQAIENGDRSLTGKTMPANGLTLINVEYANKIF